MDDDKTKWDNVVVGPWSTKPQPLKGGKTREEIVAEEMDVIEGPSESIMVNVIHTLKKNDVKITGKDFICDVGFMNEVLKSLLFLIWNALSGVCQMTGTLLFPSFVIVERSKSSFSQEVIA